MEQDVRRKKREIPEKVGEKKEVMYISQHPKRMLGQEPIKKAAIGMLNIILLVSAGFGTWYFLIKKEKKKVPSHKRTPRRGVKVVRLPR